MLDRRILCRNYGLGYNKYYLCIRSLANYIGGFPFSFGVFQDYYTSHEPFLEDASHVSLIGSCCMVSIGFMVSAIEN